MDGGLDIALRMAETLLEQGHCFVMQAEALHGMLRQMQEQEKKPMGRSRPRHRGGKLG